MPLPSKVSDAVRRLNPHLFGSSPGAMTPALAKALDPSQCEIAKPRIRQHKGDGMNKWEREYSATLKLRCTHVYREVSLPIANGSVFKIDFLCATVEGDRLFVSGYEVKGRALPAGIVKLKVAASLYPWIQFVMVTKRKKREGGGWSEERILP